MDRDTSRVGSINSCFTMTIRFDRPIGTPANFKELEYLSALHQTCLWKLRQDASIDGVIVDYMIS
jgi:hypothetical protein